MLQQVHRPRELGDSGCSSSPRRGLYRSHRPWIGTMKVNTEEVIEALLHLLPRPPKSDSDHRFDPSRLPLHPREALERHLPKKPLKQFLLDHPDLFRVHDSGPGPGPRQFSIKTSSRQPPPPTYTGWSGQAGWNYQDCHNCRFRGVERDGIFELISRFRRVDL